MLDILSSKDFYEKYKSDLTPGEFKFITKAFRQSDNTVALFQKENNVDCYFQLPGYKSIKVPENRKWIYKLPKGSITKDKGFLLMDDDRYKIPVSELEIWSNPYEDPENVIEFEERPELKDVAEVKPKESLMEKLKRLDKEVNEKVEKLEHAIKVMSDMEEKILKTLEKFEHVD